jgi:hypothetical protein
VKLGKNVRRKAISVADGHATEKDPEPDSVWICGTDAGSIECMIWMCNPWHWYSDHTPDC